MHQLTDSGGEGASGTTLQVPLPSLLLYTIASMTGWGTRLQDLIAARVWSWEENLGELSFPMSNSDGLPKEAGVHCFQGDVQSDTGDCALTTTALSDLVCKINTREEEHLSKPVVPSRYGPSHRVVTSSLGV